MAGRGGGQGQEQAGKTLCGTVGKVHKCFLVYSDDDVEERSNSS
jgi:hypothetical protein